MGEPQRRVPEGSGWSILTINNSFTAWQSGIFCALSSLIYVEDEHLPLHQEWLVSFTNMGKQRLNNQQVRKCLIDFNALDFEEDNHESGVARKYWYAVEQKYRKPCPCKDEKIIKEGDYEYSVKNNQGE